MATGWDSVVVKGTTTDIVGTGDFAPLDFAGLLPVTVAEGPGTFCAQLYFQLVPGYKRPRGWIVRTGRVPSGDGTAEQAMSWPSDWPFTYLPAVYVNLDYVSATLGFGRSIELKLPVGERLRVTTRIFKADSAAAFIGARITPTAAD